VESGELADVVIRISEDLVHAGHPDAAATLAGWAEDLRSSDPERQSDARHELRAVVHGIGGLIDMLNGPGYDTQSIDALWQAIKVLRRQPTTVRLVPRHGRAEQVASAAQPGEYGENAPVLVGGGM
jgi:hypothetical protein